MHDIRKLATVYVRGYRPSYNSDGSYGAILTYGEDQEVERSGYLAGKTLIGEVDYRAAIAGLELASGRALRLHVVTSSPLVFDQMRGHRPIKGSVFVAHARRIDALLAEFESVQWRKIAASDNPASDLASPDLSRSS